MLQILLRFHCGRNRHRRSYAGPATYNYMKRCFYMWNAIGGGHATLLELLSLCYQVIFVVVCLTLSVIPAVFHEYSIQLWFDWLSHLQLLFWWVALICKHFVWYSFLLQKWITTSKRNHNKHGFKCVNSAIKYCWHVFSCAHLFTKGKGQQLPEVSWTGKNKSVFLQ